MRVLAAMLIPRGGEHVQTYELAMQGMLSQTFSGEIECYVQSGEPFAGPPHDRIALKYERARQLALEGGFDALWTIEYDMICNSSALAQLADTPGDIVYGLYCWRHYPYRWNAYVYLDQHNGVSLSDMPERARDMWGKTIRVKGLGNGCTLFRRKALERLTFTVRGPAAQDWYVALDADRRHNLKQVCNTNVVCGHMSLTPRPFVVWPDPQSLYLYRMDMRT